MDKLGAFLIVTNRKLLQAARNLVILCVKKLLAMKVERVSHPVASNFSQTSAIKLRLPKNKDIKIVKEPIISSVEIDDQIVCNKETLPNLDLLNNPRLLEAPIQIMHLIRFLKKLKKNYWILG